MRASIDLDKLRNAGLNVVFDAMHATGAGVSRACSDGGTTRIDELRGERNPAFPGMVAPEPIARNLAGLMETVVNTDADVGLATDGDADRLGVVDEKGHFVDQHQTYALLCYYLLEYRGQRGPIVRSLTSTRMIDRLGAALRRARATRRAVGFKYLGPKMMEINAMTAGEESGGYAFAEHLPERDGCYAGLLLMDLLARSGKTVSELVTELYAKVGGHFYDRIDVHMQPDQRQGAIARVAAAEAGHDCRPQGAQAGQQGRLPVRVRRRLAARAPLRHGAPAAHLHGDHGPGPGEAVLEVGRELAGV